MAFATVSALAFSPPQHTFTVCPSPTDLVKTAQTGVSISYAWTPAEGISEHVVMYVRHGETSNFTSQEVTVSGSSFTFTGLAPGRYTFYIASKCGSETSGFIVTEDIING